MESIKAKGKGKGKIARIHYSTTDKIEEVQIIYQNDGKNSSGVQNDSKQSPELLPSVLKKTIQQ